MSKNQMKTENVRNFKMTKLEDHQSENDSRPNY